MCGNVVFEMNGYDKFAVGLVSCEKWNTMYSVIGAHTLPKVCHDTMK